jgi:hypothetical protein
VTRVKTNELLGAALDRAVAAALNQQYGEDRVIKVCRHEATTPAWIERENAPGSAPYYHRFGPSTDWKQGGPIIERERLNILDQGGEFTAHYSRGPRVAQRWSGPTPLIAAMRCFVASRMGDEIDVPEELLT